MSRRAGNPEIDRDGKASSVRSVGPEKTASADSVLRPLCRQRHLRLTPQRLGIFLLLQGSKDHPSADSIFREIRKTFPRISFDTVNRTLISFARFGLLKVVEGGGKPKRYDPDLSPHHHFHCLECKKIIDFDEPAFDRISIPASLSRRFAVRARRVVLEGLCEDCQKRERRKIQGKGGGPD